MTYEELQQQINIETGKTAEDILRIATEMEEAGLDTTVQYAEHGDIILPFAATLKGEMESKQIIIQGKDPQTHEVVKELRSISYSHDRKTYQTFKPTKDIKKGQKEAKKIMTQALERVKASVQKPQGLLRSDREIEEQEIASSFNLMIASIIRDKGIDNIRESLAHAIDEIEEYCYVCTREEKPVPTMNTVVNAVICNPDHPQDILYACEDPALLTAIAYKADTHELLECGKDRQWSEIRRLTAEPVMAEIQSSIINFHRPAARTAALIGILKEFTNNFIEQNLTMDAQVRHMDAGLIQVNYSATSNRASGAHPSGDGWAAFFYFCING